MDRGLDHMLLAGRTLGLSLRDLAAAAQLSHTSIRRRLPAEPGDDVVLSWTRRKP